MAYNKGSRKRSSFFVKLISKINECRSRFKTNNKNSDVTVVVTPSALILVAFVLLIISKFVDVTLLNRDNEYMSVIILQMMIFLLPGALWCMLKGEGYVKGLSITAPKPDTFLLILAASLVMMSGSLFVSMAFVGENSLSNVFSLYDTFTSKQDGSVSNALYLVLAYAALPAVCEEFIFRGILCREYVDKGALGAIFLSSLFFAMLHFNVQNLPVYFFCGCILALVQYATRSLWGAVITHFLYNLFGVFGQPYMATLYKLTKESRLLVIIAGIVFFSSAALFCAQASKLYRKYLRSGYSSVHKKQRDGSVAYFSRVFVDVIKDPFTLALVLVYIIAILISWF